MVSSNYFCSIIFICLLKVRWFEITTTFKSADAAVAKNNYDSISMLDITLSKNVQNTRQSQEANRENDEKLESRIDCGRKNVAEVKI